MTHAAHPRSQPQHGGLAVAFLKEHLRAVPVKELESFGDAALSAQRNALGNNPSPGVRRRVEDRPHLIAESFLNMTRRNFIVAFAGTDETRKRNSECRTRNFKCRGLARDYVMFCFFIFFTSKFDIPCSIFEIFGGSWPLKCQ